MLGIENEILFQVAEQKTEHSWMLPIMQAAKDWDELTADHKEWIADNWAEQKVTEILKEENLYSRENEYLAERVARYTLLLLLENRAVSKFTEEHPEWNQYLLEVLSPEEAVEYVARDVMYVSEEMKEVATLVMKKLVKLPADEALIAEICQQ